MSVVDIRRHSGWLGGRGPEVDVVLSSRARLARNIAGYRFVATCDDAKRGEVMHIAHCAIQESLRSEDMHWVDLAKTSRQERKLLLERHLISSNLLEGESRRAVAFSDDESLSIMVNEEDHLRMQVLESGLQLTKALERISTIDDAIESRIEYAFNEQFGYLTACPTNVGTGLRLSVMVHLPALRHTNELDRVRRSARDLNLAVRGFYGEGSESAGDFYQISNQVTLGFSRQDLLDEFRFQILPDLIEYERSARRMLIQQKATLLDDRVHRALGILRNARMLTTDEAMKLLSRLRLGAYLGRITDVDERVIDRLFLHIQSAHLQELAGTRLKQDEQRAARASMVRRALGGS